MLYTHLIIYLLTALPTWCLVPEDGNNCKHRCFHQPALECPKPQSTCRCQRLLNCTMAAICCDVTNFTLTEGLACAKINMDGQFTVEALHIRNATLDVLNVTLPVWRRLKYMTITDGKINSIEGEFAKLSSVSCLNLSSNGIEKFEPRSLVNLFNLSFLDLSHNNLMQVPRFKKGPVTLDISDNPKLLCSNLLDTLKRTDIDINNDNDTTCLSSKTFQWFNETAKLPLSQIQGWLELEKNCIENCTCQPHRLEFVMGKPPTFSVAVNCSGAKLLSLPTPLPQNTILLNITNNNITSLKELSDPSYQYLLFLYADNNEISTIQHMEGTKFMSNFMALSLKNNKIKMFETYLLSNIKFDRTSNIRYINLGQNKLHCDCKTAKEFKVWLLSKSDHVPDYEEIGCDNMDAKIIELDQTKLCQSQQDWTDYIYYIITAEVLLLVGLIAKVSYDYWVFKTAGYLPWPASKMPKLPCDWLCE